MEKAYELTKRGTFFSKKLSLLQFVGAIMVISIHAWEFLFSPDMKHNIYATIVHLLSEEITQWAVPMFFATSAFMLFRNYKLADTKEVYKKRIIRLAIPYVVWGCINELVHIIVSGEFHFIKSMLNIIFYKTNAALWFLAFLMIYTVLTPLIYTIVKNKTVGLLALAALGVVNLMFNIPQLRPDMLFFYVLGAYLSIHYMKTVTKKKSKKTALIFFVIFIAEIFCMIYDFNAERFAGSNFIYRLIMLISVWNMVDFASDIPENKIFVTSYFIYLAHMIVLQFMNVLIPYRGVMVNVTFFALARFIVKWIGTTVITLGVGMFLKKHMKYMWRILTGEKLIK